MTTAVDFDIVIVGGGMVGLTMACALGERKWKIGILEAFPFNSDQPPSFDTRSVALAHGSRNVLKGLGLWSELAEVCTPIKHIHVSDRGHFGTTRLNASEENVEALGYVIENRHLGKTLLERVSKMKNVTLMCPARLSDLTIEEHTATLEIDNDGITQQLKTKLVIAADGGNSAVNKLLNIDSTRWEYGQTAIVSTVATDQPHSNIAYERFTDSGPLALLPLSENRQSLVYTVKDEQVDAILALDDQAFLNQLQARFGFRLGRFTRCAPRKSFPLSMMRIKQHIKQRVVIIGNAAHTLHPVAGQGFNLGVRDVAALAEILDQALNDDRDLGALDVLEDYERWRRKDQLSVTLFTDGLARIFANPLAPVRFARSKGLAITNILPPLKHALARHAMGLNGKQPKLCRGQAL